MKDFRERLGAELATLAEEQGAADGRARRPSRRPGRRASWLTGAAALAASVAAAAVLTQSPAQALPVLERPPVIVADPAVRAAVPAQLAASLDFSHGRRFDTPWGTGYVAQTLNRRQTCVILPFGSTVAEEDSYGINCEGTALVERRGLIIVAQAPARAGAPAKSLAAAILPDQNTEVSLTVKGGSPQRIPQDRGVVVVETRVDATMGWTHEGRREEHDVAVAEAPPRVQIDCGPNKPPTVWEPKRDPVDPGKAIRAARKRLCR